MKLPILLTLLVSFFSITAQHKVTKPEIGIVADFEQDSLLYANGYKYLVESVVKCFSPIKYSDQQFEEKLKQFQNFTYQFLP
jgi:hypothetical protein